MRRDGQPGFCHRTAGQNGPGLAAGAGGGIVADRTGEDEYQAPAVQKAVKPQRTAFVIATDREPASAVSSAARYRSCRNA